MVAIIMYALIREDGEEIGMCAISINKLVVGGVTK
jgi:hypothetical protein